MFKNDYRNIKLEDEKNIITVQSIYKRVQEIWETPIHSYYTDHSTEHSERILVLADNLLNSLYDDTKLSEDERFILIAASYLHDVGMQMPELAGLRKKENYTQEEKNQIRAKHHLSSEKYIMENQNIIDQLNPFTEQIAIIARYHREDGNDISSLHNDNVHGKIVRIPLLAAILRLCDELDLDNRRVNFKSVDFVGLDPLTKMHWYSHEYVDSVFFNEDRINLKLKNPYNFNKPIIVKVMLHNLVSNVQKRLDGVYRIMHNNKLFLYPRLKIETPSVSERKLVLDDDLVDFVSKYEQGITYFYQKEVKSLHCYLPLLSNSYRLVPSHIYLGIGGCYEIGAIDPRYSEKNKKTVSQLIIEQQDYVLRAVPPYSKTVTIHVNKSPNIDTLLAILLIKQLLAVGKIDNVLRKIVKYVSFCVSGRVTPIVANFFTLYMYLYGAKQVTQISEEDFEKTIKTFEKVINVAHNIISSSKCKIDSVDFLSKLKAEPFLNDITGYLQEDYNKFLKEIREKTHYDRNTNSYITPCEVLDAYLHEKNDIRNRKKIKTYFWRREPDCEFHWIWPKNEDVLTFVPITKYRNTKQFEDNIDIPKYYFSLRGDSKFSLKKLLVPLLKMEEDKRRVFKDRCINKPGIDKNKLISFVKQRWSCPKRYSDTLLVSPVRGSLLTLEEVEKIFSDYIGKPTN